MSLDSVSPLDLQTTFIDWMDIRQDWLETVSRKKGLSVAKGEAPDLSKFERLPVVCGGIRARAEELVESQCEDGNVYFLLRGKTEDRKTTGARISPRQHEGSHSTKLLVDCDGQKVRVSGNVGRQDRPDNVWNYGLEDTILKAAEIVRGYGLPEFSRGVEYMRDTISAIEHRKGVSHWAWSGAYFAELHVTRNHYSGGEKHAIDAMRSMSAFRSARISKGTYGDETLNFGMPTKKGQRLHKAIVVYRKAAEMLAHAKGDEAKKRIKASEEYQHAHETGLIRIECKWGREFLRVNNLRYWGAADMAKIISLFNEETTFLLNADPGRVNRVVADMPTKLRAAALLWIQGQDLKTLFPKTTYHRHVNALRDYGIDAAEPRNVSGRPDAEEALERMLAQSKTFNLIPAPCPDWYGLPEIARAA